MSLTTGDVTITAVNDYATFGTVSDSALPSPYVANAWFQGTGSIYRYTNKFIPSIFRKKYSGDKNQEINNSNVGINNKNQIALSTLNTTFSLPTQSGNKYLTNQSIFSSESDNEYYSRQ